MKKIIMIMCLFLLTGCDVVYNLNVEDSFIENASIVETNIDNLYEESFGESMMEYRDLYLKKPMPLLTTSPYYSESNDKIKGIDYYEVKDLSTSSQLKLEFNGTIKSNDYMYSRLALTGCKLSKENEENEFKLKASNFHLFDSFEVLDKITINIISKYSVKDNNADKVSGNKYTWIIDRSNYENKVINISFNTSNLLDNAAKRLGNLPLIKFAIVILAIVIVGFIIYVFVKKRFTNKNTL